MNIIELMKVVKDGDKIKMNGQFDAEILRCKCDFDGSKVLYHNDELATDVYMMREIVNSNYEIIKPKEYHLIPKKLKENGYMHYCECLRFTLEELVQLEQRNNINLNDFKIVEAEE